MDYHTLKTLEFQKITDLIKSHAASELGASITDSLLIPQSSLTEIQTSLRETTEFKELIKINGGLPMVGLRDVRQQLDDAFAQGVVLEPGQFLDIALLLKTVQEVENYIGDDRTLYPLLLARVDRLDRLESLSKNIGRCIGEDASVKDNASPQLARIRRAIKNQRSHIKKVLEKILARREEIVQENLITLRNGRYVIPLRTDFGKAMEGIIHDKSQSGLTFFVEPGETVEINNELAKLIKDEETEVYQILRQLTDEVKSEAGAIENNCRQLAELDFVYAKARFSLEYNCREPLVNTDNFSHLLQAKHPLLLLKRSEKVEGAGEEVVPLTITIGQDYETLLISGPNTGGKTVALKTAGLLNLMAQAGCHIPVAEGSNVGIFRSIFADIGDEQSIEQSLSTFSSHMKNIIDIANRADESSLVLLDELGSGTDPLEGAALGVALLEHLTARKVKTIATTHHDLLKTHVYASESMENGSFEFDPETLRPTYRFQLGVPGGSNALEIAERLGLPEPLLQRSRVELGDSRLKIHHLISELKADIKRIEEEREGAAREKKRLQGIKERYLKIIHTEKEENEKSRMELQRQVKEFIARSRSEIRAALEEIEARADGKPTDAPAQRALARVTAQSEEIGLEKKLSAGEKEELHKGDQVFIQTLGLRGILLDEPSDSERVYVKCEDKTLRVPLADLVKDESSTMNTTENLSNKIKYELHIQGKRPADSLNIIGKTIEEALPEVDKALDDAFLQGVSSLTIIHGMGTGRLREAVEELLGEHPLVKSFEPASRQQGGRGATVVEI